MTSPRHLLPAALLAASALVLLGCPKTPEADPIEPGPRITSFRASETLIDRGGQVTLSWETQNAASVKLENPRTGQAVDGATDPSGSVQVNVNDDTLFVLTAVNLRGAAERQAVTVRVKSSAHDLMLYALPTSLVAGESAIVTWSAPDAQSVTITATPGGPLNLNGQTTSGSVTVTPTATTTYTLTADSKTATTAITVRPRISSLTATPTSAPRGGTIAIAWQTAGAVELTLSGAGRGVLLTETDAAKVASGTHTENIPATVDAATVYSYTLTAKDAAGTTTTKELLVYVQGVPVVKTFTGPKYARTGQTFTLNWTTEEADGVTLSAGGAVIYQSPDAVQAKTGSLSLNTPAAKTTYTLTATNSRGGSDVKTLEVEPVGAPSVTTFIANPTSVNAGEPVTLSWTTLNGPKLTIREATDGVVFASDAAPATGTATVYPNHNAVYTVTIDNGFNETATGTTNVTVTNPVVLTSSMTGTIPAGSTVQLTWNLASATSITGLPHTQVTTRSPSTAFDDISTTGSKVVFPSGTTDVSATLPTSFPVNFLGANRGAQIQVNVHGYMVFGPWVNPQNYLVVDLPTGYLEPYSIAPYWADLSFNSSVADSGVYWQIKTINNARVLIVQWNKLNSGSLPVTFQAKVYETGQVDFEYATLSGTATAKAGIQGPRAQLGLPATIAGSNTGLTFFGPLTSPVSFLVPAPMNISGSLPVGNGFIHVNYDFNSVVTQRDLFVSEVMARPHGTIATTGEWLELSNTTAQTVTLTGWNLLISDGGTFPLSGTIPPHGSVVLGQSTDPAQNGDAGVSLALAGLDLNDTAESVVLQRTTSLPAVAWTSMPDAGTARVFDLGPIKIGSGSPSGLTCAATQLFSSAPAQLGSPGTQTSCGFGYVLQSIPGSYFDIGTTGTAIMNVTSDTDGLTVPITLPTSAPAPIYFGVPRPVVSMSNDGWMVFSSTTSTNYTNKTTASSSTTPVGTLAPFWDDQETYPGRTPKGEMHWKRIAAGEDPKNPAAHWIFQWTNQAHYNSDDFMNWQVKMFDDGVIEFHYGEMRSDSADAWASGDSATVWIENLAGTQVLPVSINSPSISPHSAYRFSPR